MIYKLKDMSQDDIDTLGIKVDEEMLPESGVVRMVMEAMNTEPKQEEIYQQIQKYEASD